jgi:ABC-type transporter Mla maintaining outer membrane lipid asymmetry permease subunit MlaE
LMFCLLTYFLGVMLIGAFKSRNERQKLLKEFYAAPGDALFTIAWIAMIYAFVLGILLAPIFGEFEFLDTGWKIWQLAGIGALVGWMISWSWKN